MALFRRDGNGLVWTWRGGKLRVEPWGQDSLRVRATRGREVEDSAWALLPQPSLEPELSILESSASIRNGAIRCEISAQGRLQFCRAADGAVLLAEVDFNPNNVALPYNREYQPRGATYQIASRFAANDDERFFGLGQRRHGRLNQKGCALELVHRNASVSIPFLVSSRGYGFLWHHPGVGRVELALNGTTWVAESARQVDYWITIGSYADIMARYADATGHAPLLPEWASGFWQSKLRYRSQEELLRVAREYKRRALPLSVIVIDYYHWTAFGEWGFDREKWPDPQGMVRELDEMGAKLMVSVWPAINPSRLGFAEMRDRGLLVETERGQATLFRLRDVPRPGPEYLYYYDPTNPEARAWLWERIKQNYVSQGISLFWLDACEPEINPLHYENLRYHIGSGAEVAGLYPLMHAQCFAEGLKSLGIGKPLTLCRSAWAGSQRYGAAVWSGDIDSSFRALRASVPAGLNIMMSGIPWWTTDIGGFMGGDVRSPAFQELIVRWFQFGAFCPLFRLHGYRMPSQDEGTQKTGADNEVWSFGETAYQIIRDILHMRERLRPYVMEQMRLASERGLPPMRPLFFDFPLDPICLDIEDSYLFGPDILVAPILDEGARLRKVYLPAGTHWRDAWSGQRFSGGQWVEVQAPLQRIPIFLRGEAGLPISNGSSEK